MKLKLNENFIERIVELETYEQIYAALWITSRIKHEEWRENGAELERISKIGTAVDIYNLGYVQALIDLKQPLRFKNKPSVSQEFLCRGFDALGVNVLDKEKDGDN